MNWTHFMNRLSINWVCVEFSENGLAGMCRPGLSPFVWHITCVDKLIITRIIQRRVMEIKDWYLAIARSLEWLQKQSAL
jgi:hypothetical protein